MISSKIKKFKIFPGTHIDDRPDSLISEIFKFIHHITKLKTVYNLNK